ncbi:MAG TPA: hypothetical protein VE619_00985 [Nitrososphaeraceae archaeon]|jgi:hypothetical protein|nr:hypothetical protein [Nitrososphaeraceae archaeon]HZC20986.1 hypothetical protein [Nitrososphaeraceae archaeon]
MKHHKKEYTSSKQQNVNMLGDTTAMLGKDILTLTFNIDVAKYLNFKHNESLTYEISKNQLIIKKKDEEVV